MVNPLIFVHVALGEIPALALIWIIVELLNPTRERVRRAVLASLIAVVFVWLVYIVGGYYYVVSYPSVRNVIVTGSWDWAHRVFMEVKEHIFLFGPYLITTLSVILYASKERVLDDDRTRKAIIILSIVALVGEALMLSTGVTISSGYRVALEGV